MSVADLCREHGVNTATLYNWKAKYGGLDASQFKRIKELEEENSKLVIIMTFFLIIRLM